MLENGVIDCRCGGSTVRSAEMVVGSGVCVAGCGGFRLGTGVCVYGIGGLRGGFVSFSCGEKEKDALRRPQK